MNILGVDLSPLFSPGFLIGIVVVTAGIYTIFTLGLQLNVSQTGIMNFGQVGFAALGAYGTAIFILRAGLPTMLALVLGIIVANVFSLLMSLTALRLRAEFLAIAMLVSAEAIRLVALNWLDVTHGDNGLACDENNVCFDDGWNALAGHMVDFAHKLGWSDVNQMVPLAVVEWAVALVLTVLLVYLKKSPWGRVLRAIAEDEDAARAVGHNTLAYKMQSMAIGGSLGALAGFFIALNLASVSPAQFNPLVTFLGFVVLLIGGLGNYWAIPLASLITWFVIAGTEQVDLGMAPDKQAAIRYIIAGVVIMALMAFRPQGLMGKREEMVLGD